VTSLLEVRATADEIASGTNKLFQAVEGSYAALSQLSQTAKQLASNGDEALTFVEGTSASVEEINASVKEVEKSARESTELAEGVRALAAEEGLKASNEAIDAMEAISGRVRSLIETIKNFGNRSKDIEKMLTVIKEVTEQTNLLSLNAAILAAQAGEYGKGFSVVADEMRALSERTSASTKEIAGIVKTIHSEIAGVTSSIEESMGFVERGKGNVYKARESTGMIVEKAQRSAEIPQQHVRALHLSHRTTVGLPRSSQGAFHR
jgi:methyl-accepting chemotaxis protein